MKHKILALILFCMSSVSLFAQSQYEVRGLVTDTAASYKMVNSTITLLKAKDSTLVTFTRATADGSFSLSNLSPGKFILLLSYPGYADYVEGFQLDSAKKIRDFGQMNMTLKATILKGVIIQGNIAAIKIKGDTTEFNAAAYKIQPNSKVEDLLKQLPGITVDKNGKITAQGKTVNKVLVDGEEFFGDDPTLVTKNLRGDMVDKVQLYDKKSDQAAFTGIDDGQKNKTINIQLKEDKKNGYFGKVDAGAGTEKFYQGQGMFNAFKGKKKLSAYGTIGNTGKTGLGWEDNDKYAGSQMEMTEDGGMMFFTGGGDDGLDSFSGRYDGRGIPLTRSGGVHFDNKWNKDKETINTNYKIGSMDVDGTNTTLTQNNIPKQTYNTTANGSFNNRMFRQKLDAAYSINLDSNSTLKVSVDGTLKDSNKEDKSFASSTRDDLTQLNTSDNRSSNDGNQRILNASAFYTHKLKKKGRTFSLRLSQAVNDNKSTGFLYSDNQFFDEKGIFSHKETVDQYKTNNSTSSVFNSNLTYTEPLSKVLSLIVNYGLGINKGVSDRKSFNKATDGSYSILDQEYSNSFELNQLSNQGGAIFNFKKGKSVIDFGTKISDVKFEQFNKYTNTTYKRNFTNWNPQASFRYNFSQMASFSLSYNGSTRQPGIDQLQPLKVNTDPLNIIEGNPNLRPSFNSSINAGYNSYKVMSGQSIYVGANYGFNSNAITNSVITDKAGKSTSQSINLSEKTPINYGVYVYLDRKIKLFDMNIGLNGNMNGSTNYNLVDQELNNTKSNSYGGQLRLSKYKEKGYALSISAGPTYNTSESSLQKQLSNNGWGTKAEASFSFHLPGKLEIGTDGDYEYRAKTQTFNQEFERFIWNASISKKFFKEENLKLTASANDLLNQNVGFDRNSSNNRITQSNYTTIKRYFMLSLIWDFNKMGGSAPKP
ncbi:outer membrane beta-barrel family protein [Pedobacter caeni]|uniref:Outer membrane receptor proteins, mostly Fe transport n=1 Tax=Pedobacter caeni TaxID=288992 RepID=A0A1M5D7B7_9SPHI|nr:outer membrane beta-barrel family protein [Pedobacter caeni]SHF62916.1 Outer membrane receptor proteins, mostly Fe transport [Pedobacter caeni]